MGGGSGAGEGDSDSGTAAAAQVTATVWAKPGLGVGGCNGYAWWVQVRLLDAQGLGGNWNEGVWSSPSPFCKPVEQLNGHGS